MKIIDDVNHNGFRKILTSNGDESKTANITCPQLTCLGKRGVKRFSKASSLPDQLNIGNQLAKQTHCNAGYIFRHKSDIFTLFTKTIRK